MEDSSLWTTGGAGDGTATITRADWSSILAVVSAMMDDEGVAPGYLNALIPSTTGVNNARIGTGGGVVDGKPYWNSAAVDTVIPSASGGGNTRIDRLVLRADWTAQTVRITRIAGTDAASPTAPAITQTSGSIYDIKLCQTLADTGGTVTITDERILAWPAAGLLPAASLVANSITQGQIADNSIGDGELQNASVSTNVIQDDAVDDTKAGDRVPQFYRRQGGSATNWSSPGTTTYTPTSVRMQAGVITLDVAGSGTVTFPTAFSNTPVVQITGSAGTVARYASISATQLVIVGGSGDIIHWLCIGPE